MSKTGNFSNQAQPLCKSQISFNPVVFICQNGFCFTYSYCKITVSVKLLRLLNFRKTCQNDFKNEKKVSSIPCAINKIVYGNIFHSEFGLVLKFAETVCTCIQGMISLCIFRDKIQWHWE